MPSNRKRKNTGGASSSSAAEQFDRFRFVSKDAENNFAMLMNRSMPKERVYDLSYPNRPIIAQAMNQHWGDFIRTPNDAIVPIVKEFYANLRVDLNQLRVKVSGKMVPFDSRTVNALYNLPNIATDGYINFIRDPVDFDELLRFMCYPGANWKLNSNRQVLNFPARYLKQAASAVFLFINARLMPAKHDTNVTKERAMLMYCILKGYTLDVGKIIEGSILLAARSSRNINLPHSSVITALCQSAGVEWDATEEKLKVQVPIKVPTLYTMEDDNRPTARASGSTSQQQHVPPQPRPRTVNQRLAALENDMRTSLRNNANFMSFQVEYFNALAARFPDNDSRFPPFPPAPEWEEDTDEEEEEKEDEEEDDDEH